MKNKISRACGRSNNNTKLLRHTFPTTGKHIKDVVDSYFSKIGC